MRFGSLFSGIGGIDLGLERAGFECAFQVENEPYCLKVLAKHWPNVTRYEDIKEVDFERVERVDLLAGGFPCQDLSYAGKGAGLSGERSGLWGEFVRAIRVVRPRYVLVENVPGLLSRGMGVVLGDLSSLGYDAEWESIPAAAFGAPHLRWRVFIVAYAVQLRHRQNSSVQPESGSGWTPARSEHDGSFLAHSEQVGRRGLPDSTGRNNVHGQEAGWEEGASGLEQCGEDMAHPGCQRNERRGETGDIPDAPREAQGEGLQRQRGGDSAFDSGEDVADSQDPGCQTRNGHGMGISRQQPRVTACSGSATDVPDSAGTRCEAWSSYEMGASKSRAIFRDAPTHSSWWEIEPPVGRVVDELPRRVDRLRGLGNAVVPQVAEWLGNLILEHELLQETA